MPLIRGLDDCWVVTPSVAELLAPVFREFVTKRRALVGRVEPNLLAELDAAEQCARVARDRRAARADPDAAPVARPDGKHDAVILVNVETDRIVVGLRKGAVLAGISPQSLHERCRRGTLPFEIDGRGRYVFRAENLTKGRPDGT